MRLYNTIEQWKNAQSPWDQKVSQMSIFLISKYKQISNEMKYQTFRTQRIRWIFPLEISFRLHLAGSRKLNSRWQAKIWGKRTYRVTKEAKIKMLIKDKTLEGHWIVFRPLSRSNSLNQPSWCLRQTGKILLQRMILKKLLYWLSYHTSKSTLGSKKSMQGKMRKRKVQPQPIAKGK